MRILMVSSQIPYPLRNGNQIYEYNLARHLSSRHELDLLALADAAEEGASLPAIEGFFRRTRLVVGRRTNHLRRLAALVAEGDILYNRDNVPMFRRALVEALRDGYDAVQVNSLGLTPYADLIGPVPKLAVPYDCQSLLYSRAAAQGSPWRAAYCRLQSSRLAFWERRWLPRYDRCVVVSQVDATQLAARSRSLAVEVIPFGVDTEHFRPLDLPEEEATIVFTGNMTYFPNAQAARDLVHEILPRIRQELPSARVRIVGDRTGRLNRELQGEGVEVVGFTDVRPHLAAATVCVSPLRIGAGFKNKVVEAMAMGKALVATPLSLDGIEATPGEHLLSAAEPAEIAAAVLRLLRDKALRRSLGDRARALVTQRYSWAQVAARFSSLYAALTDECARVRRGMEA